VWGNQASVLVGDFLLGQAFRMMVDVGSLPALKILSTAAAVIAEGEVLQLAAAKNTATTEDDYLTIISAKTRHCSRPPPRWARRSPSGRWASRPALKSYGRNFGIAFQLVDDALDYSGDSSRLGKSVGDDFREGKITLPVILCFRRGSEEERAFWNRALGGGKVEDGDLERAISLMKKHSAIERRWSGRATTARSRRMRWPSSRRTATPRR
jgi:octaprenyl-diphosphate synthase